jgi:hypothetical protein
VAGMVDMRRGAEIVSSMTRRQRTALGPHYKSQQGGSGKGGEKEERKAVHLTSSWFQVQEGP